MTLLAVSAGLCGRYDPPRANSAYAKLRLRSGSDPAGY